jgi:hypothetical protein
MAFSKLELTQNIWSCQLDHFSSQPLNCTQPITLNGEAFIEPVDDFTYLAVLSAKTAGYRKTLRQG